MALDACLQHVWYVNIVIGYRQTMVTMIKTDNDVNILILIKLNKQMSLGANYKQYTWITLNKYFHSYVFWCFF